MASKASQGLTDHLILFLLTFYNSKSCNHFGKELHCKFPYRVVCHPMLDHTPSKDLEYTNKDTQHERYLNSSLT